MFFWMEIFARGKIFVYVNVDDANVLQSYDGHIFLYFNDVIIQRRGRNKGVFKFWGWSAWGDVYFVLKKKLPKNYFIQHIL